MEVEIEHGKVVPKEPDKLPESGHGLLTILPPAGQPTDSVKFLQALEELQKRLNLDEKKAAEWVEAVRDARR